MLAFPRATVLRCFDASRTFTLSTGLLLGMSHKALATIAPLPELEHPQTATRLSHPAASVKRLRLVSSQDTPLPSNTPRPHLRLIAGGQS